ncbi:MAG: hypothetical protein GY861_18155 [bacterium]|nr:hypothetical protein [bacterium]
MKFINLWDENNQVVIKTKEGIQRIDYDWYFCVLTSDYLKNKQVIDDFWHSRKIISNIVAEETVWTRIYVQYAQRRNVVAWIKSFIPQTYEADLRLWQRYLVDEDISLETDQSVLYFDIECDDLKRGLNPGDERITSIAAIGSDGKEYFTMSTTDEAKILKQFVRLIDKYDILSGWYSEGFDLVAISRRCWLNRVPFDCKVSSWSAKDLGGLDSVRRQGKDRARPEKFNHIDLMQKMKELHYRDTDLIKKVRSFSLSAVSQVILGRDKTELNGQTMYSLARENPDLLQEYNMNDVRLVKELDEKLQITKQKLIEHESCNARVNDYTSHGRVDPFALREARKRGKHLRSKPDHEEVETVYTDNVADRAAIDPGDKGIKRKGDYIGGYVFDPEKGLHDNVTVFDFQSLYPSIIKTFNISIDSYLGKNVPGHITIPSGDTFSKTEKGIVPSIIQDLLDKRNHIRWVEMKKVPADSEEYQSLHYKQYSFKVLANSMYGIMGANFSRYYKRECAEGITIVGQYLIKKVWDWFEEQGHHPIYGDTDSIFVILKEGDPKEIVKGFNVYLTECLKTDFDVDESHLVLAFEKTFSKFISVAKKKYVGLIDGELKMTGLEAKKRDTLPKAEEWQRDLMDLLLHGEESVLFYLNWVEERKVIVDSGQLRKEDLTYQKRLSREIEDYGKPGKNGRKTPVPIHVKVAKIIKEKNQGTLDKLNLYSAGCYIPYIVASSKKGLVGIDANDFDGEYDKEYYWDSCYNPSKRILEVVFPEIDWDTLKPVEAQQTLI